MTKNTRGVPVALSLLSLPLAGVAVLASPVVLLLIPLVVVALILRPIFRRRQQRALVAQHAPSALRPLSPADRALNGYHDDVDAPRRVWAWPEG